MQIIRSSYGLMGIVFEVTIRVRRTTALSVRHYSMGLADFRKRFPVFKAQGYAVMYYIFPYARRVVVELRKDNPDVPPRSRRRWSYRNRFWRKYGPAITLWIRRSTTVTAAARYGRPAALLSASPSAGARRAQRRDLAPRPDHQLSARSRP